MLAAAVPLAAFVLMERRTRTLRRLFSLTTPRRRDLAAPAVAVAVIPALLAVAVAQPVFVRREAITQRADALAFFVFDTSLSMSARADPDAPTRLQRAEEDVRRLLPRLGNLPVGIATMTDRVLPNLMPTTNDALILRTIDQSVAINSPPPSMLYPVRATSLSGALLPLTRHRLFPYGIRHPVLVVFTDGESDPLPSQYGQVLAHQLRIPPIFVHVSEPNEGVYVRGRLDPKYHPDPRSGATLEQFAKDTNGRVFGEDDVSGLLQAIRKTAGPARRNERILGFNRVALAPWFVLGGVVPLGFLFWRRNL